MDEFSFSDTASGHTLQVYRWTPRGDPKAIVVLAHGYGEHAGRYGHVGERLSQAGYLVVAPDHHGHGKSTGRRGIVDPGAAWRDLDALREHTLASHPDLPVLAVGHSLGGALVLAWALDQQREKLSTLQGIVLSSPLVDLGLGSSQRQVLRLLGALAPFLKVAKIDPAVLSRDPAVVAAYAEDPLNWHHGIPIGQVGRFMGFVGPRVDWLSLPTLYMWGSEDRLCRADLAAAKAEQFDRQILSTHVWPGLRHEIFNEPEQDDVLDATVSWLDGQLRGARAAPASA